MSNPINTDNFGSYEKTSSALPTWKQTLQTEKQKDYFKQILSFLNDQYSQGKIIYPPKSDIFNAFRFTELHEIKVVILGQDPYHGEGQAHGLSFSVKKGVRIPPSLINIYKELETDIEGFHFPTHGCLEQWAKQGILLLNTVMTVEASLAASHAKVGWETFTDKVITTISEYCQDVVFLLWGSHAQKKANLINANRHHILTAVHPSPLAAHRGFFGCKHFSKTNQLICQHGKTPINWQIT